MRKNKGDLPDTDHRHTAEANGRIRRHPAQRPSGYVRDTRGAAPA
ncbi:hypothetical protein [Streptomyces litmocidini]